MLKRLMVAVAASTVLSCTASKPPPAPGEARTYPQVPAVPPPSGAPAAGTQGLATPAAEMPVAGSYRVDSSQSELRLLVYRAGALASLGHDHVIQNRSVNGSIDVAPTLAGSSFLLSAAVSAFVVDDAQARGEEGGEFESEVSDSAKLGTWNNMMGPAVLNAVQYPDINLHSIRVDESQGKATAAIAVSIAGHDSSVTVPFVFHKEAYGLSASASFELNQTALGMTPYSLMLGALAVRDTMVVKLKVIAQLEAPRPGSRATSR
jgi:YceI-like domain